MLLLEALQLIEHTMNVPFVIEPDDQLLNLLALSGDMANAARMLGFIHADLARSGGGMSVFCERMFRRAEGTIRARLSPEVVATLMEEGARIPEDGLNRELQRVVRQVIGRQQPDARTPEWPIVDGDRPDPFGLTNRELDVLRLVAAGASTGMIATTLQVSPRTVGTHISNVLAKMGVSSRTAAVALAAREGVIALDGDGAGPGPVSR
jgi:DNA-binding CsgD family transcriptional regulator